MATAIIESGVPSEEQGKERKPKKKANKKSEISMEDQVASYFASINPMAKRIVTDQMKYKYDNIKVWKTLNQTDKDRLIDGLFIIPQLTDAYVANQGVSETTTTPPPEVFPKLKVVSGQKMVVYTDEGSSSKAKTFKWKDEYSDPFSWETKSQLNLSLPSPEEDIGVNLPKTPKPSEQDFQQLRGSSDSIDNYDYQDEQSEQEDQRTEPGTIEGTSLDKLSFDFDFDKKSGSRHSLQFSLGDDGDSEYDNVSVHSTSSNLLETSQDKLMEEFKEKMKERERSRETMASTSSSSTTSSMMSDKKEKVKHPKVEGYVLLEEKPSQVRKARSKEAMTLDDSEIHANLSAIRDMKDSPKLPDKAATMPASGGGAFDLDFLTNW
ncbi:uncharacterized protein LOC144448920 [Glandiceps talaboti]